MSRALSATTAWVTRPSRLLLVNQPGKKIFDSVKTIKFQFLEHLDITFLLIGSPQPINIFPVAPVIIKRFAANFPITKLHIQGIQLMMIVSLL